VCFHSCPPPYLGIKKSESRDGQKRRREKRRKEREKRLMKALPSIYCAHFSNILKK
jgi:hypothetical protein